MADQPLIIATIGYIDKDLERQIGQVSLPFDDQTDLDDFMRYAKDSIMRDHTAYYCEILKVSITEHDERGNYLRNDAGDRVFSLVYKSSGE